MAKAQKNIFYLFVGLFSLTPLVLWPFTSEVFEFNKVVITYIFTVLIMTVWIARCISEKRFVFRRTLIDIPLLVFIISQVFSTVLSVDTQTSMLGYYSRFNGGLFSTLSYSLLYWAFVSNLSKKQTLNTIKYGLFPSALLVSLYGVLEHFGIDKNVWVQDVQSRVFSTLGQPNWLAAWLAALTPLTWVFILKTNKDKKPQAYWWYLFLSTLFYWTVLFTKSRSGLLGFGLAYAVFWTSTILIFRTNLKKLKANFFIITGALVAASLITGTQFTPSVKSFFTAQPSTQTEIDKPQGPALESGGTESGVIRKIVWKGAVDVWKHYPIFGTGVETFAYTYYQFRPEEHNLVSEWDFVYNKAHNEFLNMAATTGTVGLLAYLVLLGVSIYQIFSKKAHMLRLEQKLPTGLLNLGLISGYVSILATNFFGFSVVPVQLQLFLFPALTIGLIPSDREPDISTTNNQWQRAIMFLTYLVAAYLVFQISKYWIADTYFAKAKAYSDVKKYDAAVTYAMKAINLSPNQPLFRSDLGTFYAYIANGYSQNNNLGEAKKYADLAIASSTQAVTSAPANINFKRSLFGVYIVLAPIDPQYLIPAVDVLKQTIAQAPTDAKLYYNLGLSYARAGQSDLAIEALKKSVELKANYKEARLAYAILLIDGGQVDLAKENLQYILKYIDPNDPITRQTLEGLK